MSVASPDSGQSSDVFAVVLTGPPGVGKTAVLTALSDALSDDGIAHAAIEVEALVSAHPPLSDAQVMRHVRSTCDIYREAGHTLLLVAHTLETDEDVLRLLDAIGADEHLLVRLEAEPATLVERIVEREPSSWSGLAALIAHTQTLCRTMPALRAVDLVISTEDERAEDVAARIQDARPEPLTSTSVPRR